MIDQPEINEKTSEIKSHSKKSSNLS
jgi:hypothetical protein